MNYSFKNYHTSVKLKQMQNQLINWVGILTYLISALSDAYMYQ